MGGNVSAYLREPAFTVFLASIPTLWEETRVLDGAVGDDVVTERVAGNGDRMAPGGGWLARFTRPR